MHHIISTVLWDTFERRLLGAFVQNNRKLSFNSSALNRKKRGRSDNQKARKMEVGEKLKRVRGVGYIKDIKN